MSYPKEYNELLANKLNEIPIPDLADRMWAQLHNDLAMLKNEEPNPTETTMTREFMQADLGLIIGLIVGAIILVLVLKKENEKQDTPVRKERTKQATTDSIDVSRSLIQYSAGPRIEDDTDRIFRNNPVHSVSTDSVFRIALSLLPDSLFSIPQDSSTKTMHEIGPNKLNSEKGVKGINDSSYHIIIK